MSFFKCPLCGKEPLYECPTCHARGHINTETKTITVHAPPLQIKPTDIKANRPPMSFCFPSHFDCPLAQPIDKIDIKKLILVETR